LSGSEPMRDVLAWLKLATTSTGLVVIGFATGLWPIMLLVYLIGFGEMGGTLFVGAVGVCVVLVLALLFCLWLLGAKVADPEPEDTSPR
jgi:hypothetical protein